MSRFLLNTVKYSLMQQLRLVPSLKRFVRNMILALGTPLPANVKPWKYFNVDAVMVSAHYVRGNGSIRRQVYEKGIKEVLDFDGTVILDSGAFQALRCGKGLLLDELMSIYRHVGDADIKLSLDWPDDKIVENYEKLRKLEVCPVVPVHDLKCLEYFEESVSDWIFIGRLAKMLMHYGRNAFETLNSSLRGISSTTRKRMWALGVGNWKTIPILMQNQIDGADTSSYRVAAAFGDVIIPGTGTCHISGRKVGKKNWGLHLAQESDIPDYLSALGFSFSDLKNSFKARALFNAFVLEEIQTMHKRAQHQHMLTQIVPS